jgi:hypothetical protein
VRQPSWRTVIATTIRLWVQRHLRIPGWRVALLFTLAATVVLTGAATVILTAGSSLGSRSGRGSAQPAPGSPLAVAASVRRHAASWVDQEVNADAIVSCDPAMCAALEAAGVPASRLLLLRTGQGDPLGSDILVATAALRSQFGDRLETVYAPVTVAAFGSGAARVEIRVIAPDGAAAYLSSLAGDLAARKAAGVQILRNSHIEESAPARQMIAAGRVDTRLLVTLVTLAASHPLNIIGFGAAQAPGASTGLPLRSADITGAAMTGRPAATTQELRGFLAVQRPPYRPSRFPVIQTASRTVIRIEYPAPSPLGLLESHG